MNSYAKYPISSTILTMLVHDLSMLLGRNYWAQSLCRILSKSIPYNIRYEHRDYLRCGRTNQELSKLFFLSWYELFAVTRAQLSTEIPFLSS